MLKRVAAQFTRCQHGTFELSCYCSSVVQSQPSRLMGHKIRTDMPQLSSEFIPKRAYLHAFRDKDASFKQKQKTNYDQDHCTRS